MPRVLYCARTRPPLEPPFHLPPSPPKKPPAATTATQQPYWEYDSDTDEERPPSPELPSSDTEGYRLGDECFDPGVEYVPDYANIALEHYNSQDKNKIKYQLIKAIVSSIIRCDGSYYHLNFTAKTTLENSKEEFFFAELRIGFDGWVPVSIVVLEENERVGGFSDLIINGGVDPRHCFACGDVVKHPVDGTLYEAGHYLVEHNGFFHKYIEVLPATQLGDVQN